MNGWKRSGRGDRLRLVATLDAQEVAVLRGLVDEIRRMLGSRADEQPDDELAELTGLQTGPSTPPDDPVLARLLPDFATPTTPTLSGGLRSLHEPELIAAQGRRGGRRARHAARRRAGEVRARRRTRPTRGCAALNDVRLALGTALDITEDMPDDLPAGRPARRPPGASTTG